MNKLVGMIYAVSMMVAVLALVACSESFTDDRDGQSYSMVKIGEQVWMSENLNYAGAANLNAGAVGSDNSADLASFCPDGDDRNCKKYGRLYTWDAAQKACPAGWHLPTAEEFDAMFMAVMAADVRGAAMAQAANVATIGKLLKSTSGWFKNGNGTDAVGFNALPAGYMSGKFDGIGGYAYFWSATTDPQEPAFAQYLFLDFSSPVAGFNSFEKGSARSVRCVKN